MLIRNFREAKPNVQRFGAPSRAPEVTELAREYAAMVEESCRRYGIETQDLEFTPIHMGQSEGLHVFVVRMTVGSGTLRTALQLSQATPIIEQRISARVGSTWVGEHSKFSGVWTHWKTQIQVEESTRHALRALRRTCLPELARAGAGRGDVGAPQAT